MHIGFSNVNRDGGGKERQSSNESDDRKIEKKRSNVQDIVLEELGIRKSSRDDEKAGQGNKKPTSRRRRVFHRVAFMFLLLMDVADFLSDWLFYVDVTLAEQGLVYGPVSSSIRWALLAFSIIGTLTFIIETVNLWCEYFRERAWVDSDLLSAVVVWIEDVPQIIISVCVALCREEAISVFQTTKAAVIVVSVAVRVIICSAKYCNKEAVRSHHHVKYKVAIMLGVILETLGAIAIFILTQTKEGGDGGVAFRIPTTLVKDRYDDQKYFANVSIFAHHPDLFDAGQLDPDKTDKVVNWVRLVSINSIRVSQQSEASFSLEFERSSSGLKMAFWEELPALPSSAPSGWKLFDCYTIDPLSGSIQEEANTTCLQPGFFTRPRNVFVKFKHYESDNLFFTRQVFGDIKFNMKLNDSSTNPATCTNPAGSVQANNGGDGPITFRYFQVRNRQGTHLLTDPASGAPRFFRNDGKDLVDILNVWKTGWSQCDSTGHTSPVLDQTIGVDCSRS